MIKRGFKIYSDTKVFLLCPAGIKTGGPEVIHQLVNILQDKLDAYVCYMYLKKPIVPREFEMYNCKRKLHLERIHDNSHNILIVPETLTQYLCRYKYIQKSIWWLSVNNYHDFKTDNSKNKMLNMFINFFTKNKSEFFGKKNKITHLVQSYYAYLYLEEQGIYNKFYLSDYINDIYFSPYPEKARRNIVLYNPKKGIDFTMKIISFAADIDFVPLENMTNNEIINVMRESKVYIDFGNHPGKDRLPREAATCGLCIITGKKGSAKNNYDVRIPQKYKFDDTEKNIPDIVRCIRSCLNNYECVQSEFESYRRHIFQEKDAFRKEIEIIFYGKNHA